MKSVDCTHMRICNLTIQKFAFNILKANFSLYQRTGRCFDCRNCNCVTSNPSFCQKLKVHEHNLHAQLCTNFENFKFVWDPAWVIGLMSDRDQRGNLAALHSVKKRPNLCTELWHRKLNRSKVSLDRSLNLYLSSS